MDIHSVKNKLLKSITRLKENFKGKELTEGQKYIRGEKKSHRFKNNKNKHGNFGTAENKVFKEPKTRMLVGIGPGFIGYLVFFLFAIVFTQALESSVSSMVMIFAITWIVITVIYLIVMFGSIDSYVEHNGNEVYKNTETDFTLKLVNHSFLPVPFAEADIRVPEEHALRCVRKRVRIAMHGSGDYTVTKTVKFAYRGTYDVGIDTVTVYDFFKIFRVNIRLYNYRSIYVMPRHFTMKKRQTAAASDNQTELKRNVFGIERSDVAEIKAYVPGDQMKNIHWKLSSKSEELQVKHYSMNSGKTVYIFCDMKAHFDPENDSSYDVDINEYAVDGAVELACAAASREMLEGNKCVILWNDERVEGGVQLCSADTNEEFANILKLFSTAPVYRGSGTVTDLTALVTESQNISLIFVTPNLTSDFVTAVGRATVLVGGNAMGTEVYFFNPKAKINEKSISEMQESFNGRCKDALEEEAVKVIETDAESASYSF